MRPVEMNDSRQTSSSKVFILRSENLDGDLENRLEILGYSVSGHYGIRENIFELIDRLSSCTLILDLALQDISSGLELADAAFYQYGLAVALILDGVITPDEVDDVVSSGPYGIVLRPFQDLELKVGIETAHKIHRLNQRSLTAEETSRDSETLYWFLFEKAQDAILLMEGDRFIGCNPAAMKLFRCDSNRIINHFPWDFSPVSQPNGENSLESSRRKIDLAYAGQAQRFDWRHVLGDGTEVDCEVQITLVELSSKRYLSVILHDITERKKAEAFFKQSESIYRRVFEHTVYALVVADTQGRFSDCNTQFERLLGYTKEELFTIDLHELTPGKWSEKESRIIEEQLLKHGFTETYEKEYIRKDRSIVPIEITLHRFKDEVRGAFRYWGVVQDITERKKSKEIIRESEQKYRGIFESAPVGIFRSTESGRFLDVNPYIVRTLGYESPGELLSAINQAGLQNGLYANSETRTGVLREVVKRRGWFSYEAEFLKKNGLPIICRVIIRVLEEKDGEIIFEGFIEDITDRLQAEQEKQKLESLLLQAQKMEAIGTLAGGIAHDLNNILSPIIAFTELAQLNVEPGEQADRYLTEVLSAALRARDLVKHILTFSRQSEIEKSPINLNPLVKEVVKFLRASLTATIEIELNLKSEDSLVWADPSQIHQVIMNLSTNAAQAMKPTGGTLRIDMAEVTIDDHDLLPYFDLKSGPYIEITFTDSGPGISKDIADRIFDPFYTTKERGEGTGLGLSVVHGIVKGMGGAISVYSEPGHGAVFRVYLPRCLDARTEDGVLDGLIAGGRGRILFVDDEERIVMAGLVILERLGYDVRASSRSLEALAIFEEDPMAFDLVITDVTMPKMTGVDLARRMIEIRPDIPILLCTGFSDMITPESMREIGVRDVVMKPMIIKELAQAIHKALIRNQDDEPVDT